MFREFMKNKRNKNRIILKSQGPLNHCLHNHLIIFTVATVWTHILTTCMSCLGCCYGFKSSVWEPHLKKCKKKEVFSSCWSAARTVWRAAGPPGDYISRHIASRLLFMGSSSEDLGVGKICPFRRWAQAMSKQMSQVQPSMKAISSLSTLSALKQFTRSVQVSQLVRGGDSCCFFYLRYLHNVRFCTALRLLSHYYWHFIFNIELRPFCAMLWKDRPLLWFIDVRSRWK